MVIWQAVISNEVDSGLNVQGNQIERAVFRISKLDPYETPSFVLAVTRRWIKFLMRNSEQCRRPTTF